MKKLEVTVVEASSEKIKQALTENGLQYTVFTVESGEKQVYIFHALLSDELVDKVIESVSNSMDLRVKENTLSIFNVEAHVSTFLERLEEKTAKENHPHNPLERLVSTTERYTRPHVDLLFMTFFASVIALAGLLLDNVALVIGGMLVSPLLGPINAFAVNANLGRIRKLAMSELSIIGLLLSVTLLSALVTLIAAQFTTLSLDTGQITIRQHASLVDVGIGIVLGFAGGLALFAAIPEILVGVSVAVAMVPPAAVAGIGLAHLNAHLFSGALILSFVYLVGLELGSTMMLRIRGVTPRRYYQKAESRPKVIYSILVLAVLLVILGVIVVLT